MRFCCIIRENEGDSTEMEEDEQRKEQEHQEDLQRIRGFRLIDDDFMNACFDDNIEGTELLLSIILNRNVSVKEVRTQRNLKNLVGRDTYLDILADEDDGSELNVEIQRADKGATPRRARFHSSILDAHSLKPNEDFSKLPETYVIFITENDVIGAGESIYTVERQITNLNNRNFGDGEHIIYVNGADRNSNTELGKLMHDFFCTDPDDMNYKVLADKVRYFKEDEKGVATMCKVMEDMREDAAKRAKKEQQADSVKRWFAQGRTVAEIADGEGMSISDVNLILNPDSAQ